VFFPLFITSAARSGSGRTCWSIQGTIALLCGLLVLPPAGAAQSTIPAEYRSEANALAKIPSFVDWPDSAFALSKAPFRFCVYGSFPFGTTLSELIRTDAAHGRRIEIRWARKVSDLRDCQIVFISRSEQKNYAKLLPLLRSTPTLTIGETEDFAESGGMIEFGYQNGILTFEVNLMLVEEAHIKINSRLLSLAKRILRSTETARG